MKKYQLTLLSLCVAAFAQAKVTLPSFFTDNMVIPLLYRSFLPSLISMPVSCGKN